MHSTPASHHNEEYTMPSAEALLAGTLALMTGHVQASCCAPRADGGQNCFQFECAGRSPSAVACV